MTDPDFRHLPSTHLIDYARESRPGRDHAYLAEVLADRLEQALADIDGTLHDLAARLAELESELEDEE